MTKPRPGAKPAHAASAADGLITSSVRKKRRELVVAQPPPPAKRPAVERDGKRAIPPPTPAHVETDEAPERALAEGRLPAGIPAPPVPSGHAVQPSPDHGHLPAGSWHGKGPAVLHTIFSPVFRLTPELGHRLHEAEQAEPSQDLETRDEGEAQHTEVVERQADRERAGLAQAHEGKRGGSKSGERQAAAKGTSRPASSEGGSSTDGESETCLGNRALATLVAREDEEWDGGRDASGEAMPGQELLSPQEAQDLEEEEEEEGLEFDPYAFIKALPPLSSCTPPARKPLLPRQTRRCKRKTLVLDLDETLVHSTLDTFPSECSGGTDSVQPSFSFQVECNGRTHTVAVRQRPHLATFLERAAALYEVVIFTASQKVYAEQLLNIVDPKRRLIKHRIFRDSCVFVENNYLKDLSVLGRDLAHTIIVDNSPQAFGFQLANGVPIESWYDDDEDTELMRLLPFLESLVDVPDVRPLIVNAFKLHQLVERAPLYLDHP